MMNYKGYIGFVEYDSQADIFHGEVINTQDIITFEGHSVAALKKALAESIDDYLAFCHEQGESPEKPYSGKFNLRINPETHRKIAIIARKQHKSLNAWVEEAIALALSQDADAALLNKDIDDAA